MVKAVVGANWGDEGKGKITDMLAKQADIIVRFQGGANAGHTIINDYGKFALHTLPSGVFYNHTTSVIGNGVALDVPVLINEIQSIVDRNVPTPKIKVSNRAQMVMSYHKLFDQYEEERLGKKSFGSTKSGIAPFYSDKYAKIGFQVSELFDEELLKEKVVRVAEQKNVLLEHLYHKPLIQPDELFDELMGYKKMIEPYVCDVSLFLHEALKEGKEILLEGQLGTLKDPDHGIYPMVTSSSTLAAYGAIGAGIPPYEINKIVTVCKAYSSAVGAGAFVSEIFGEEADELRRRGGDGGEYGATTGRPRRMGWFDVVASKYGCRMQGTTDVAFTVLDVLGYLDEIPVCVAYDIDGEITTEFPPTYLLEKAKPVIEKLPGWKCDIRGIRKYEDLPENCRKYIEFVEEKIGYPITLVSNGPGREDIIYR
ncbi:adenylosuccinate synthase [Drancourtella massiliensis]|uniref:Adenylosuccinate synthetase n=2 Tax=Clostridia TaxID=186801 RepID=A0A9W6C4S0_9FIRM|nr:MULTISPECIES: adenylosuccinate synthase [Clostridia]MBM6742952.1 adenylosuccinate synthase [Drancourtella massiliensis]OUN69903.1 adenylosuccinate synthase [Drancourtella sp. An57]GLG03828.1 adenylosuccinate synthetase [Sellimonas catena]